MCVKIYALKPFEADIGHVSPVESATLSNMAADGERATTDDVILAPGVTSRNSITKL